MGSHACKSRSLHLHETQIDHVIPQTANANQLFDAIARSTYQQHYFDVHDPGNLAVICGPCNQEKRDWVASNSPASLVKRIETIEKKRGDVITFWNQWMNTAKVDDATLRALTGVGLADSATRAMYAEIAATMVCNLAETAGQPASRGGCVDLDIEAEAYRFRLEPSHEYLQGVVDSMDEDRWMERRAEGAG